MDILLRRVCVCVRMFGRKVIPFEFGEIGEGRGGGVKMHIYVGRGVVGCIKGMSWKCGGCFLPLTFNFLTTNKHTHFLFVAFGGRAEYLCHTLQTHVTHIS